MIRFSGTRVEVGIPGARKWNQSQMRPRETVDAYTHWRVVENDVGLLKAGMAEMERWQLSFWDGLILAAARHAHAKTILSEDLIHGQNYNGVSVQNPFRA